MYGSFQVIVASTTAPSAVWALNMPAVLFVNKEFVKISFRCGGFSLAWINLMFLGH